MSAGWNTKYQDLYDALGAMEVGDCLPWKGIPEGSLNRITSALGHYFARHAGGDGRIILRTVSHKGVTYFVRVQ